MKKVLLSWFVAFMVLAFIGKSPASVLYVDSNSTNPVAPFSNWGTAATSIQSAIDAAVDGDTVSVTNGHYLLSAEITVTNNITVQSVNGPDVTIIDGGGGNRCFNLGGSACLLGGLTITNGYTGGSGGGILCETTVPVITNCIVIGNTAVDGGGGVRKGTIISCRIIDNEAVNNGGLALGGGLYGSIAERCVISGNKALEDMQIGGFGGGLVEVEARNCLIFGNIANRCGGCISSAIYNCTITGNEADLCGGVDASDIYNSIIYGNHALSENDLGSNERIAYNTCSPDVQNGIDGNITNAPLFMDPAAENYRLLSNSSCINSGDNAFIKIAQDLDGNPRVGGGIVDMGAYELNGSNHIFVSPALVSESVGIGEPLSNTTFEIWAIGVSNINYSLSSNVPWLNVLPSSGSCSIEHDIIVVDFQISELELGSYTGQITIVSAEVENSPQVVEMVVEVLPAEISVSASSISIFITEGGSVPSSGFDIWNSAAGIMDYSMSSDVSWLLLSSTNGTSMGEYDPITADFQLSSLSLGTNSGLISIVSEEATNSPVTIPVFIYIAPTNTYVSADSGNNSNSGYGWDSPLVSIQAAIDLVSDGGTVWLSNGIYNLTSEILVEKNITVQSVNGPDVTIVDGGGSNRCFNFSGNCTISGFTIQNGYAGHGGGIRFASAASVATNCIFVDNRAIYYGGGMSQGTADHCTFMENIAGLGGGGMSWDVAKNCLFTRNYAGSSGGGMHVGMLNNCTVNDNSSGQIGGGLSGCTARNCTIANNSAAEVGGGVEGGVANNCIIIGNVAGTVAGGAGSLARLTGLNNCIVWHNTNERGEQDDIHGLVSARYSCSPDVEAGVDGNITNAPLLASASRITVGSPCFGAGDIQYATGTDIDGELWLNPPSIGCDEWMEGTATGVLVVAIDSVASNTVSGFPLRISADIHGIPAMHIWDFGDGTSATNIPALRHIWTAPGTYSVVLTAFNSTYPSGISTTQVVEVFSTEDAAIRISPTGNDMNDGHSWVDAKKTISAGVNAQNILGGEVWVAGGTYILPYTVFIQKQIVLRGVDGPETTIVDGSGQSRCFYLKGACTVSGFTIQNGYSGGSGGGVYCAGSVPMVSNCVFAGNSAYDGGGMYDGLADHCSFTNNSASRDGGGMCFGTATDCIFIENYANRNGGGMRNWEGAANRCIFVGNHTESSGGGMHQGTARNCIVWNNTASFGNNLSSTTVSDSCSPDAIHGVNGNITNNPIFIAFTEGDYHLQSNSPCINWGNNTYVSGTTDLDGNPRVIESYVDMGCYEYQGLIGNADNDVDGMSDAWERLWFGSNVLSGANADGDTSSNGDEYVAGTDPTNAASYFHVTTDVAEVGSEARFIVEWTAVTGRVYNIFWTPSLTQDFQPLETGIQYPQNSYTDTVHTAESSGYYRVVVMRSDYDGDGDGLPNDWESQYAEADAYADGDNDGFNNLAEFISGTDPTNVSSYFAAANSVADVGGTNCFVVEWISIPDRLYSVQWSTNLVAGFQTLEANIEHPQNSYTDTLHNAESESFYKVDVRLK